MLRAGERERADINKRRSVAGQWAYYFERKRNANVFFPRRETYADVLGKRFFNVSSFFKSPRRTRTGYAVEYALKFKKSVRLFDRCLLAG